MRYSIIYNIHLIVFFGLGLVNEKRSIALARPCLFEKNNHKRIATREKELS